MKKISINFKEAPKKLEEFKKWHAKACKNDPMKSEERFAFEMAELKKKK